MSGKLNMLADMLLAGSGGRCTGKGEVCVKRLTLRSSMMLRCRRSATSPPPSVVTALLSTSVAASSMLHRHMHHLRVAASRSTGNRMASRSCSLLELLWVSLRLYVTEN